jgi:HK97 family phage portal protein
MISLLKIATNRGSKPGSKKSFLSEDDASIGLGSAGGKLLGKSKGLRSDQMWKMYERNIWVRSCVDRIAKKIAATPPIIRGFNKKDANTSLTSRQKRQKERLEEIFENPNNNDQNWSNFREVSTKDILIYGHTGVELVPDLVSGEIVEVYNVTGSEIRPNFNSRGQFKNAQDAYRQYQRGSVVAKFPRDEFLWMRGESVSHSVMPVSPLETLRQTVTAELYASQHNLDFFANNATPRLAVMFDNVGQGQGAGALDRAKSWWNRELLGQPHKPIFMGSEQGSVKLETLNVNNRDMEFQAYTSWLLMKIMAVYRLQPVVLGVILDGNQSKLNSAQQIQLFKEDALKPQLDLFRDAWTTKVIWNAFGYDSLFLEFQGFDLWDAQEKAIWHERYLRSGVFTINQVLDELGMEPVPWGDVPYIASNLQELGGEENRTGDAESSPPSADSPSSETDASREGDARQSARKSMAASASLREIGVSESQLKEAGLRLRKQHGSFHDRLISFPKSMTA